MPNNDTAEMMAFLAALDADPDDAEDGVDDAEIDRRVAIETNLSGHLERVVDEVTQEQALAGPVEAAAPRLQGIEDFAGWRSLGNMPGYYIEGVRALGRPIFRNFPCFVDFEDSTRRLGRDSLSQIQVINSAMTGSDALRTVIEWIRDNGEVVNSAVVSFERHIPNYRPELTLALSDEYTFLMVNETLATGAPADAQYVYAWPGGKRVYSADLDAKAALSRMGVEGHAVEFTRRPAEGDVIGDEGDEDFGTEDNAAQDIVADSPATPAVPEIAALMPEPPAPAVKKLTPAATLHAAGFGPFASEAGPALRRETEEGNALVVSGFDHKSVALASRFTVQIVSVDGKTLDEIPDISADEVIERIVGSPPKP